jgi:methionyl aminopeptidase
VITLKTAHDIELMRKAGKIAAAARALAGEMVKPGVSTKAIDRAVHDFILGQDAVPSFLNYNGYPASVCISVNEQVIHGIPGTYRIKEGDIVSIDVGAVYKGYHGDCAATYTAGECSEEVKNLIKVTRESFFEGINFARAGCRIADISHAIQSYVEKNGYSVVREYVGHGIGTRMHEEPEVPNFGTPGHGPRLIPGMTIAIEPMVNMGGAAIRVLSDGWTVVTRDNKPSAHYENTVLITKGDPEILTPINGDGTNDR